MKALIDKEEPVIARLTEEHNKNLARKCELTQFISQRDEHIATRDFWRSRLEQDKRRHEETIDTIERDKIIQIDNLRKEMLLRIRAVKVKMLNMNEDQLRGTTKLTVI